MENVNQCDESDEQENCKNDANDQPCGVGCGVFKESNLYVIRNLCPACKLCALRQVSKSLCLGFVCNTVYNIGNNCIFSCLNVCLYLSQECAFIYRLGESVLVSENSGTVISANNTYENEICGSCGELADVVAGNEVGSQNVTCGNGNNNGVNVTVCAGLLVAVLIGVSDGVSGVTENFDHNVGCGHCELAVNNLDQIALLSTVDGLVNLEGSGIAGLAGDGDNVAFGCNNLINGYVTVYKDVVLLFYLSTVEVEGTCGDEIAERVISKSLAVIKVSPGVAAKVIQNELCLEVYKQGVTPCCNGLGVSLCRRGVTAALVEVYSDLGFVEIDPEQTEGLGAESIFVDSISAIPEPVAFECACGNNGEQGVYVGLGEDGVGYGQSILNFAVYVVVDVVVFCGQVSGNGYGFSRHREGVSELGIVKHYLIIYKTCRNNGLVDYKVANGFAGSIVKLAVKGYDSSLGKYSVCRSRFNNVLVVECYAVLIHKSNGGEVRSVECNGVLGYFESIVFSGQLFAIEVNKGLNAVSTILACEGQNDCNGCAILKFTNVSRLAVIVEGEFVGLCTLGCICLGSVGKTDLFNVYVQSICIVNEKCKHLFVKSYLLCICYVCGQNERVKGCKEILFKAEVECFNALILDDLVPILGENNGELTINTVIVDLEINVCYEVADLNSCLCCILVKRNGNVYGQVTLNGVLEDCIIPCVGVCVAEKCIYVAKLGVQTSCCVVEVGEIFTKLLSVENGDGSGLVGNDLAVNNGNDGNGVFGYALNVSLKNDISLRHYGYVCAGLSIHPAIEAFNAGVINHFGEVGACGKESGEEYLAVLIYEINTVEVVYVNGNVKAGVNGGAVTDENVQSLVYKGIELGSKAGLVFAKQAEYSVHTLFKNNLCIKGNALFEYEGGVAAVEVHQAVVCDNRTNSGSHQTVCNLNSVALNKVVNAACVFYLINYCGVEVCKRIGGGCSLLKQILQIKFITEVCSNLFENVINGVIEITVDSVGQTVGDLNAGNVFKLLYEYFEGGDFSECIDKVLCFEVVGEVIACYSFNVCKQNLCIARCENLVVNLTEGRGIDRFQNSNYLFKGQALCKCDKVIGLSCVNSKNLILKCIEFGIGGISHLFEGNAENACKLGGDGDVCNQLSSCEANVTDLIHQSGKLDGCLADHIGACSENKAEVDSLDLFNALFIEVGDSEGRIKELTAIVKICQLVESGNEVFKRVEESCGKELDVTAIVLFGNNNTVDLDRGYRLLHGCKNVKRLNKVVIEIEHANEFLSNAGFVDNLNGLLDINLRNESTEVDCLDKTCSINDLGDGAILQDLNGNGFNINDIDQSLEVGYVIHNRGVATGDCIDSSTYTDCFNSSGVVLEASNEVCHGKCIVCKSGGDLILDNVNLNEVVIAVNCSECVYVDNLAGDQLADLDNAVIQKLLNVQNACSDQACKVGEEGREKSVTKQQNLNVDSSRIGAVAIDQFIIQINENAVSNHSVNVNNVAIYVFNEVFNCENLIVNCFFYNCFCNVSIHIVSELILNTVEQAGEYGLVNVCGDGCRETSNVCIYKRIQSHLVYIRGSQGFVTNGILDVEKICSSLNVNAVQLNSCIDINDFEEFSGSQAQSQIHQLISIIVDKSVGINVRNSLFDSIFADVTHQKVNILNVILQIDFFQECYKTCFIYASKQSIRIDASKELLGINVSNDRLDKVDDLLFGKDRTEFFLGHNASKTAGSRKPLNQSLYVAVLEIGQQGLGINGNGNVGGRYVLVRLFFSLYAQPCVSDRTDRQNCQNHYDCQQHSENLVELFHNTNLTLSKFPSDFCLNG